jgi:Astacin (Peptidase family M12A)
MGITRRSFAIGAFCCVTHACGRSGAQDGQTYLCAALDPKVAVPARAFTLDQTPPPHFEFELSGERFALTPYGVASAESRWRLGDGLEPTSDVIKLGVAYLNGSEDARNVFRSAVDAWNQTSVSKFVQFVFDGVTSHNADIRVDFGAKVGNQSLVGRNAKAAAKSKRTMNIDDIAQVVCEHELGHALGLLHEHQFPGQEIRWKDNGQPVIEYTSKNFGWSKETTEEQILRPFPQKNKCVGDPYLNLESVMSYWILPGWAEYKDPATGSWRPLVIGASQPISPRDVKCVVGIYSAPAR